MIQRSDIASQDQHDIVNYIRNLIERIRIGEDERERLAVACKTNASLQSKFNSVTQENAEISLKLEGKTEELAESIAAGDKSKEALQESRLECSYLKLEVEAVGKLMKSAEEQIGHASAELVECDRKESAFLFEISGLSDQLTGLQSQVLNLNNDLQLASRERADRNTLIETLQNSNKDAENSCRQSADELVDLRSEIERDNRTVEAVTDFTRAIGAFIHSLRVEYAKFANANFV